MHPASSSVNLSHTFTKAIRDDDLLTAIRVVYTGFSSDKLHGFRYELTVFKAGSRVEGYPFVVTERHVRIFTHTHTRTLVGRNRF